MDVVVEGFEVDVTSPVVVAVVSPEPVESCDEGLKVLVVSNVREPDEMALDEISVRDQEDTDELPAMLEVLASLVV